MKHFKWERIEYGYILRHDVLGYCGLISKMKKGWAWGHTSTHYLKDAKAQLLDHVKNGIEFKILKMEKTP